MSLASNEGVRIFYEVVGEPGPLLLLHTGGGGDSRMWRMAGYTDGLSATRLILMDHRGHGRSDRPAGVEAHRIDRYVGDVVSVLDAAGAERVVFAGYSDGANVGYAFAAAASGAARRGHRHRRRRRRGRTHEPTRRRRVSGPRRRDGRADAGLA